MLATKRLRSLGLPVAVLLLSTTTLAQERGWDDSLVPDTPAGAAFGALGDLLESGARDAWLPFVDEHVAPRVRGQYSDDDWTGILEQMERLWSDLDLRWVGSNTPTRFGLVGQRTSDPLGSWYELFVTVTDDGDWLTDLDVVAAAAPAAVLTTALSEEELVQELRAMVARLEEAELFSGAVLLADADGVLFERAAGLASVRYGVPNTLDTRFCLGSMTKMFTACAVLALVEAGELSLDDPIGKYLGEEWVGFEAGDRIRVEHLLTHSAGTGDFFRHPDYPHRTRSWFRDVDSFADFISVESPAFEPGTRHAYSNSGFILLGAILEEVTGRDYHEYMRETFYAAHGMTASDCFDWDVPIPDLATGYYELPDGGLRSNVFSQRVRGCPAGSSYSTARDLLAFARRFQAGEIVPPHQRDAMISPRPELGSPSYGYGVQLFQREPVLGSYGHGGGGPGVASLLAIYPETGHVVVVLANAHTHVARALGQRMNELLARLDA